VPFRRQARAAVGWRAATLSPRQRYPASARRRNRKGRDRRHKAFGPMRLPPRLARRCLQRLPMAFAGLDACNSPAHAALRVNPIFAVCQQSTERPVPALRPIGLNADVQARPSRGLPPQSPTRAHHAKMQPGLLWPLSGPMRTSSAHCQPHNRQPQRSADDAQWQQIAGDDRARMPTTMVPISPRPPPLIILRANQPATAPITSQLRMFTGSLVLPYR
jgi:hypothetical protein